MKQRDRTWTSLFIILSLLSSGLSIVGIGLIVDVGGKALDNMHVSSLSTGSLSLRLTDAPFPRNRFQAAHVTIRRVELVDENDSTFTLLAGPSTFNLLKPENGISTELAQRKLPFGTYKTIRVLVDPKASLTDAAGRRHNLTAASRKNIWVTIPLHRLKVQPAQVVTATLGFKASKSFVANPKAASFKPGKSVFQPTIELKSVEASG